MKSELYAIGMGSGETLQLRPLLMETKLLGKLNVVMETASSSGERATTFGASKKTRHVQLRYIYIEELFQRGTMKFPQVVGEQNPSDILTNCVCDYRDTSATHTLLQHDDCFKCVPEESSARAERLHMQPSASCCVVTSALPCQCFVTQRSSETSDDQPREVT